MTSNYNKLSLHKQAFELLEVIIEKEERLAEEKMWLAKHVDNRDYVTAGNIVWKKHLVAVYERWLGFFKGKYAALSEKICQKEKTKPWPINSNYIKSVPLLEGSITFTEVWPCVPKALVGYIPDQVEGLPFQIMGDPHW